MTFIIDLIMGNLASIGSVFAIIAALFGYGEWKKRQGEKEARQDAKDADFDRAIQLRNKADAIQDDIGVASPDERRRLRETSPARRN